MTFFLFLSPKTFIIITDPENKSFPCLCIMLLRCGGEWWWIGEKEKREEKNGAQYFNKLLLSDVESVPSTKRQWKRYRRKGHAKNTFFPIFFFLEIFSLIIFPLQSISSFVNTCWSEFLWKKSIPFVKEKKPFSFKIARLMRLEATKKFTVYLLSPKRSSKLEKKKGLLSVSTFYWIFQLPPSDGCVCIYFYILSFDIIFLLETSSLSSSVVSHTWIKKSMWLLDLGEKMLRSSTMYSCTVPHTQSFTGRLTNKYFHVKQSFHSKTEGMLVQK